MLLYLLQGATLGLSATASPGPFQAYLLAQALQNGWRRTLPATLAPLVSDGPIVALVLLLLTQTPAWFLGGLQVGGGLFLLYLARQTFLSLQAGPQPVQPADLDNTARQSFWQAVLMNALSPGPYLFWGVLAGPILIDAWRQSPPLGLSFVLGFYLTLTGGFASFVLIFATARRLGNRVTSVLQAVLAVVLLLFGLYQLWVGASALLL